jgi:hypothetical protein
VSRKYKITNRGTEGNDICVYLPSQEDARGTVGGTGSARKVRATRDSYVSYLSLKQLGFLSLIIDPESKYAFFIFERGLCRENLYQRVPITVRGRTVHRTCGEPSIQLVLRFFRACLQDSASAYLYCKTYHLTHLESRQGL